MLPSSKFVVLLVGAMVGGGCASPHAPSRSSPAAPARAATPVASPPDTAGEPAPAETAGPADTSSAPPPPLSPAAERAKKILDGELDRAMETPSVKRLFLRSMAGVTDLATAHHVGYVLGERLGRRGASRLTGRDLEEWADARFRLAQTGADVCAGLWTGKQSEGWLYRALGALPEEEVVKFGRLTGRVMAAEASNADKPLPAFPAETFRDGLGLLLQGASQETNDRVVAALERGAEAEQADACATTRLVFGAWRKLPATKRAPFLHAVAIATAGE